MTSVGMPFSISRSSAGAFTISPAHAWQAYLARRVTITLNCAGTTSSSSETSSPIRCLRPPQHAQVLFATSMMVSSRGRCGGSAPRLICRLRGVTCLRAVLSFSAAASPAASVYSTSSKRQRELLGIEQLGTAAKAGGLALA